ncbi:MAG: hypothetical protein RLZ92_1302 [Pseudomonadota bacterium]
MDVQFEKNGVTFVWDLRKSAINSNKHGITFEQATAAFFDPLNWLMLVVMVNLEMQFLATMMRGGCYLLFILTLKMTLFA